MAAGFSRLFFSFPFIGPAFLPPPSVLPLRISLLSCGFIARRGAVEKGSDFRPPHLPAQPTGGSTGCPAKDILLRCLTRVASLLPPPPISSLKVNSLLEVVESHSLLHGTGPRPAPTVLRAPRPDLHSRKPRFPGDPAPWKESKRTRLLSCPPTPLCTSNKGLQKEVTSMPTVS